MNHIDYRAMKPSYTPAEAAQLLEIGVDRLWFECAKMGLTPLEDYNGTIRLTAFMVRAVHNRLYREERGLPCETPL